jgi:hypothetical protein
MAVYVRLDAFPLSSCNQRSDIVLLLLRVRMLGVEGRELVVPFRSGILRFIITAALPVPSPRRVFAFPIYWYKNIMKKENIRSDLNRIFKKYICSIH